jgi:glycosyltransferase involved in cell wall biosynthesis
MKIVSDIHGLDRVAPPGDIVTVFSAEITPGRWKRVWRLLRASLSADYLVIHFSLYEVLLLTTALSLVPGCRCRLVSLDFFAINPPAWLLPWVRWCFQRTAVMLVYFKDSRRFEEFYRLPKGHLRHIPFKVNSWDKVQRAVPVEEPYVFVGGRSRRDFRTLFEAVAELPVSVKVLTAREPDLTPHGSSLEGLSVPKNVEILYNDSDPAFFVQLMSRAKLVVLPIRKDAAVQAGIGVCLLGMALGKCVIVSEALGISDVLDPRDAVVLPAGDVELLRKAIARYWDDGVARGEIAARAKEFAWSLGGEDQLRTNILQAVREIHQA